MKNIKITIVVPDHLDKLVEAYARQQYMTKSGVFALAVSKLLKEVNKKEDPVDK